MALIDIDRLPELMGRSWLTGLNRFAPATFDDRDHLGDPARPLRERVAEDAAKAGLTLPDGPVYLLTHLRYFGYAFNPISFYYCCDRAGTVRLVMGEVHSTFGEQCTYWLTETTDEDAVRSFRRRLPKIMHVSPFMPMSLDYEFIVTPPGPQMVAHMNTIDRAEGVDRPNFDATLTLTRQPWTSGTLAWLLARHPFMTAKVIGAIHWEALRLWMKGLRYYPHPETEASRRAPRGGARA